MVFITVTTTPLTASIITVEVMNQTSLIVTPTPMAVEDTMIIWD